MSTTTDEDRAEAQKLALLPPEVQAQILAGQKAIADNPRVPRRDREEAARRYQALKRLLKKLGKSAEKQ
jgi:hypothetical protein